MAYLSYMSEPNYGNGMQGRGRGNSAGIAQQLRTQQLTTQE